MSAYADKIAMEVLEADERAGSRGVAHPPLEWHKAVALAHAVSKASPPEADQRDAARYRWMQREVDLRGLPEIVRVAIYKHDGNALDLAIDAAMRQSAPEGKE